MATDWEVVAATGKRIDLERGFERKSIAIPSDPQARQIFQSIQPGQHIDDATIETFLLPRKKK
jgi:hypothetical protein